MTGNTFFSRLGDLADRSKFASDPINLTHSQDREHTSAKENSMRSYMEQNSIALCDNRKESTTFQKNRVKQPYSSVYGMETIPDVPDHAEAIAVETRDDQSVPTLMDEDLIVPHPFGQSLDPEHEVREEAIEIINISFLHE